jgi:hypothetical protein
MEYVRLTEHLNDFGKLIPVSEDVFAHISDRNTDHYKSIYYYNEDHYNTFKREGTIAGITDVTTPLLVWDFDSKNNVDEARRETIELCARLMQYGVPQDAVRVAFSGNKGFSVEIETDKRFTPEEFKIINRAMADGLKTNDPKIYNASRIFRVPTTKHQATGLYKLPLTVAQLEIPIEIIRGMAQDYKNAKDETKQSWQTAIILPDAIYAKRVTAAKLEVAPAYEDPIDLDFKSKPKGLPNCKFAVLNGFFKEGNRSNLLTALCATLKYLGYPKEITYSMLKGAARMQGQRTGAEPFPKTEIWNNVIETVFSSTWQGGQYSCKTDPALQAICNSLGANKCRHEPDTAFIEVAAMTDMFAEYAKNIDSNTIKTGIPMLDDNVQLTIGMPVALLGAPGSGKTSLALDILENTSMNDIDSAFFEMDMYGPLVYMKKLQRHTGVPMREIQRVFRDEPDKFAQWCDEVNERYKRVAFSLKSGQTVQEMREAIHDHQDRIGRKVKLVMVDYLECIAGPFSDATANTAKIAGELKDFATEMGVCVVVLVQPPKSAGDAGDRLTSMRQIKGSSMLEQSFRVIFGIHREGFSPEHPEWDKFMTISALKNTMGPLFSVDCLWDGVRGKISEINDDGLKELADIRVAKKAEREKKLKESGSF